MEKCRGRGSACQQSSLPNGDIRRLRGRRHQRGCRKLPGPCSLTGIKHHGFTGHFNPRLYQHKLSGPPEGRIPGPNTGFEVIVPGRQGFRA